MAAALFRRGTGLCVRCIHRELCRLVWRPQTALFSSKASDRKQPRRTHIKKAKPQPALDVAKLLEQLFSQRRPGTVSPVVKAPPAKASSTPLSSLSAAPVETLKAVKGSVEPAPAEEPKTKSTDSGVTAKDELLVETITESPVETCNSPVETQTTRAAVVEGPVEPTIDTTVDVAAETKSTDSGVADVSHSQTVELLLETSVDSPAQVIPTNSTDSGPFNHTHTAAEEPLIETIIEPSVETSTSPLETLENRAAVSEGSVETTIETVADTAAQEVQTNIAEEEPLIETTIEPSVEASALETQVSRAAFADFPLEPTVGATVDSPAQTVPTNFADLSHLAEEEPLIETKVEPSVQASTSPLVTLEDKSAEDSVEATAETVADTTVQSDSDISFCAKEEHLIETTIESEVEARTSIVNSSTAVCEDTIEAADNLSSTALNPNAQESAALTLENKEESPVESSSGNVPVEAEKMTLESITLHDVQVQVEALKAEELLQTNAFLDGKAEQELQELLVHTGSGAKSKAVAETGEEESENLSQVLSNWDSLSEDLQVLEGESGTLVKELLCHVNAVVSKVPDPPAGANGDSMHTEEKGTETETMTLESVTLANVKAEVGGLEAEVLQETRNELEKEAEVLAKEEKMEVTAKEEEEEDAAFDSTTEAELLALDSISEATDAIEAETSVILEAMFGSEQGPRQPAHTLLVDQEVGQQTEVIGHEAEKESGQQEGSVLEAMTLESVTLAEVEASLGTLESESLSETTGYLEKEAGVLTGEKKIEVKDEVMSEEATEDLNIESLSLPEEEPLQVDALIEELLFSVPGPIKGVTKDQIDQEAVGVNISDAVATGSVNIDAAAVVTDDFPASPAPSEVLQGEETEEEGAQTEALGDVGDAGTHTELDPVQRLFLEKIREYSNMQSLNAGPLGTEPDFEKKLSEETAKLQRLYGEGDLSSFPEFTFTEPKMDQDS